MKIGIDMDINAHKNALHECIWMLLGSFIPIFVDSFFKMILLKKTYMDSFIGNINSGEVFLFTSALITPFFFFLLKNFRRDKSDESKDPVFNCFPLIFLFSIIAFMGGLVAFCFYRIGVEIRKIYPSLDELASFDGTYLAIGIYVISLAVWYYASYYNHRTPEDFLKTRENQKNNLLDKFNKVRNA